MKTRVNKKPLQGKSAAQAKIRIPVAPPTQPHSAKNDPTRTQTKQALKKILKSQDEEGL